MRYKKYLRKGFRDVQEFHVSTLNLIQCRLKIMDR